MNDPISNWGTLQTPYSQEAEEATIGAILVNSVMYFAVAAFLKADDFFILRHRYIWEGLTRLHERGEPIDYLTITQELKDSGRLSEIGGPAYLTQLINSTPTSVHAEVYGRLVERAAVRRRLMAASDEIKSLALNEELTVEQVIADAESRLFDVTERQTSKELIPMKEAVSDYFDRIEYLMANRNAPLGVPSGFKDLDKLLGGFQKSDLIIFAGRPGMGKCVAEGTLITTENGIVPIESLQPQNIEGINDDEGGTYYPLNIGIQTPEGIKQTSHFYDSGLRQTLHFQTRAGYSLTGTHVHPVLVLSPSGHKVWKSLSELNCGDYVAVQSEEVIQYSRTPLFKSASPINGQIAEYVPVVSDLLEPQFHWDEIVNIEDAGLQHCYDLTVPDGHTFVANGIVNHNTSFMLSAALNMARLGQRIAIFSMEMGVEQIVQRLISMESAINSQSLRLGQLNQQEWARFVHAAGNLSKFPIYIDDSAALNPLELRTKCLRMQREHGLDLVVVDYLQLMNAGGTYENNRVQEVSYISRNMKELAREFNVPILSAAQLSRAVEQRQDKRPQLSDLRESGCLSGDSLVYLPDEGRYTPIRDLCGKADFNITSLNATTYKLESSRVSNAFCTGVKPVYHLTTQLGRTISATANHKFLTINGWKRLDELTSEDHIALPCQLSNISTQTIHKAEANLTSYVTEYPQASRLAEVVKSEPIAQLATSDVYWDKIARIEADGETDVYDLTVPGNSNFVVNDIIAHNSLEQDADIVMFLYRDEMYNEATEFPNQADIIVSKHRNGPTGTISLFFEKTLTKFMNAAERSVDLSHI